MLWPIYDNGFQTYANGRQGGFVQGEGVHEEGDNAAGDNGFAVFEVFHVVGDEAEDVGSF